MAAKPKYQEMLKRALQPPPPPPLTALTTPVLPNSAPGMLSPYVPFSRGIPVSTTGVSFMSMQPPSKSEIFSLEVTF